MEDTHVSYFNYDVGTYVKVFINNTYQGAFFVPQSQDIVDEFRIWKAQHNANIDQHIKSKRRKNKKPDPGHYADDMDWYGADWRVKRR